MAGNEAKGFGKFVERFRRPRVLGPQYNQLDSPHLNELSRERLKQVNSFVKQDTNGNIRGLVIFGSTARGKAQTDSDIDYLLINEDGGEDSLAFPQEDTLFGKAMSQHLPFRTELSGYLSLKQMRKGTGRNSWMTVINYFLTRKELAERGVQLYNTRNYDQSMITDWTVIAKNDDEIPEIVQAINDMREKILRLRNL